MSFYRQALPTAPKPKASSAASPTSVYNPPGDGGSGDGGVGGGWDDSSPCARECRLAGFIYGTPEADKCMQDCFDRQHPKGYSCVEGTPCTTDQACHGGKCEGITQDPIKGLVSGKCKCSGVAPQPPECPAGSPGTPVSGHPECACGGEWNTPTNQCPSGYVFQQKQIGGAQNPGMVGRCICESLTHGGGTDETKLGAYQWPTELTDLYQKLMGRAGEYLGRKPGYSQSAIDAMFGKGYENVRNLGTVTQNQAISNLQREGMLGTGAGQASLRQIPWQTEQGISDIMRNIFLTQEEQKRKDLESYTGIAQNLFGTGTNFNTILESINASRRGEGQNALAMWMNYLMSLMNSWKTA